MSKKPVLTVGFITSGLPFDGDTIKMQSLGGSETAMYYMAKSFAALGHRVYAICQCYRPGVYDGVAYSDLSTSVQLAGSVEFDVLVVSRFYSVLTQSFKAKQVIYWAHDMPPADPGQRGTLMGHLYGIDQVFVMSEFQKAQYLHSDCLPDLALVMAVTRNGVDIEMIDRAIEGVTRKRNRVVYASRPERGLLYLLEKVWPLLVQANPELELYIAGYDVGPLQLPEEIQALYIRIAQVQLQSKNVFNAGNLKKEDYYKLLASSSLMLYPTAFPEISCINALEALACGTPLVSTSAFALPETAAKGAELIPVSLTTGQHIYTNEQYLKSVIFKSLAVLSNDLHFGQLQTAGKKWVRSRYDWFQIAQEWEDSFIEHFERRVARHPKEVLRNLVRHDDFVAAHAFALQHGFTPEAELYASYLESAKTVRIPVNGNCCLDPVADTRQNTVPPRIAQIAQFMVNEAKRLGKGPARILDIGCFKGGILGTFGRLFPEAELVGFDVNPHSIDAARERHVAKEPGFEKATFILGRANAKELTFEKLGKFDYIFCGETMEHIPDTTEFLLLLRELLTETGSVYFTVPSGCWLPIRYPDPTTLDPITRAHVHHFEMSDLCEIFEDQPGFKFLFVPDSELTYAHELRGWWTLIYQNSTVPFGTVDLSRKFLTTRPWFTISCIMITKNEAPNLLRCLDSVASVVDEIVIVDTGSQDNTMEIAAAFTDKVVQVEWPEDFSIVRNKSMEIATGDWIFWIDADEILLGNDQMRKYTQSLIFNGYVIRQNHLMLDFQAAPDVPIRLFRNHQGYKFYGVIHEHCEEEMDTPIHPALMLPDVDIAHFGYVTEKIRRQKCKDRNINLLLKDRRLHPHRKLGIVLMMRDYLNFANWSLEKTRGQAIAPDAIAYLRSCIQVFKTEVSGTTDKVYTLSFPLYQNALAILGRFGVPADEKLSLPPFELAFSLAGGIGGLTVPPKTATQPDRVWFSTREEMEAYLNTNRDKLSSTLLAHAQQVAGR